MKVSSAILLSGKADTIELRHCFVHKFDGQGKAERRGSDYPRAHYNYIFFLNNIS